MSISDVKQLEELTKQWEPRLREAFLQAVLDINSGVNLSVIIRLISEGAVEQVLRELAVTPSDFAPLAQEITNAFNAAGKQMAKQIPPARTTTSRKVQFQFNIRNPEAEAWLKDRSSTLITSIVEDTRQSVRQLLAAGLAEGNNPRTTALELVGRLNANGRREGGVIGLTPAQEQWARAYREELETGQLKKAIGRDLRDKRFDRTIAKASRTGKPIPKDMIEKMVSSYRNRTLKYRADNIARTETLEAVNEAQHQSIVQAVEAGALSNDTVRRFVVTAGDERVRPEHKKIPGMNRSGVKIDQPFKTPSGPKMRPPFDVNCRCQVRMRVNYFKGLK